MLRAGLSAAFDFNFKQALSNSFSLKTNPNSGRTRVSAPHRYSVNKSGLALVYGFGGFRLTFR
jgi:hypothetical protein